MLQPLIFGIII